MITTLLTVSMTLTSVVAAAHPPDDETWTAVPKFAQGKDTGQLGNTHGGVVIDKEGLIYSNTDSNRAIVVHRPDGTFVRAMAAGYPGIHGMAIREEDGQEFIYAAHLKGKQVLKFRLDGTLVWALGVPMESGKYNGNPGAYNPTGVAVAPDGTIFIVDGYGQQWVHVFGPDLVYRKSFGGRGTGDGQFQTCHGVAVDTRGDTPRLLVADRENRRIQRFDLEGNFIDIPATNLRRPCALSIVGDEIAIAELEGRVTVLDENFELVAHVGDNPKREEWAKNGVPKEAWIDGVFTAPHGCCLDKDGNLYVSQWNATGRLDKIERTANDR